MLHCLLLTGDKCVPGEGEQGEGQMGTLCTVPATFLLIYQ